LSRVIHFEISADDPNRAVKFYGDVFSWKIEKWDPFKYWVVTTGSSIKPGINGAIMPNEFDVSVMNTINVDNYDEFVEKIVKAGGKTYTEKRHVPELGVTGASWIHWGINLQ
jgi:uncharacterized protein